MSSLQVTRQYLAKNRRMILGRSVAAAIAGSAPIPYFDEWITEKITQNTIVKIAESRNIDLDSDAAAAITSGKESTPGWVKFASSSFAARLFSRHWQKMLITVVVTKRSKAAVDAYEIATLFDHYAARVHQGMGLNRKACVQIRALIDQARRDTTGNLSRQLFRRALEGAIHNAVEVPLNVINFLTGGRVKQLLSKANDIVNPTDVDETVEHQLSTDDSILARAVAAIERQISVDRNPYLITLVENFDRLYQQAKNEGKLK